MSSRMRYQYFKRNSRFLWSFPKKLSPSECSADAFTPAQVSSDFDGPFSKYCNIVTISCAGAVLFNLTAKHFGLSTFFSLCLVLHEPVWINLIFHAVKPMGTKSRKLLLNTGISSVVKQTTFVKSDTTQVYIINSIALAYMLHVSICK